jgi:hypothetical protein
MRTASPLILLAALFVDGGEAKAQIIYGNPAALADMAPIDHSMSWHRTLTRIAA